jgi:cupin fold WbuC family metalloprotein
MMNKMVRPFDPARLREAGPGIFYGDVDIAMADQALIQFLKDHASSTPLRRARFCAHPAPDATQHDMLIVTHQSSYVAPHRHRAKSETFLVLEGRVDAIIFDETGQNCEILPMGTQDSGRCFFYRMPPGRFHSQRILSENIVFFESTKGPFDASSSEYAPWAPAPNQADAGRAFIEQCYSRAASTGQ